MPSVKFPAIAVRESGGTGFQPIPENAPDLGIGEFRIKGLEVEPYGAIETPERVDFVRDMVEALLKEYVRKSRTVNHRVFRQDLEIALNPELPLRWWKIKGDVRIDGQGRLSPGQKAPCVVSTSVKRG